jgi:hypothetical protein
MWYRALLVGGLLGVAAPAAGSQGTTRIGVSVDSRLWIEGASNLNHWSCRARTLDAAVYVDSGARELGDIERHLRKVTVTVPVAALTCGHAPMDKSLRAALKADEGPATENIVATLDVLAGDDSASHTVHTAGSLMLAGRKNTVTVDIDASIDSGALEARGELPILLSDYGIVPPTGLFGAIRCADRVVVKFALTVVPTVVTVSSVAPSPLRKLAR